MHFAIILYISLLNSGCLAQAISSSKNEVVFTRNFHEPSWLYYTTTNSTRLTKPLLVTLDAYEVSYRLTPDSLLIHKRPYTGRGLPSIIYTQALCKADKRRFICLMAKAQSALTDKNIVDDGLAVKITLASRNNTFFLIADKQPEIANLLDIVDRLAPKKYNFRTYIPKPKKKW